MLPLSIKITKHINISDVFDIFTIVFVKKGLTCKSQQLARKLNNGLERSQRAELLTKSSCFRVDSLINE